MSKGESQLPIQCLARSVKLYIGATKYALFIGSRFSCLLLHIVRSLCHVYDLSVLYKYSSSVSNYIVCTAWNLRQYFVTFFTKKRLKFNSPALKLLHGNEHCFSL